MIITTQQMLSRALKLACDKGLEEMSIQDLANSCGIRKSSVYSHFQGKPSLISDLLSHCQSTLNKELSHLVLNTSSVALGLSDLAFFLYSILGDSESGLCYTLLQSEKLRNNQASVISRRFFNMLTARCEVLLEQLASRNLLNLEDTHYPALLFCSGLENLIDLFLMRQKEGEKWEEFSWEIDKFCDSFITLLK